MIDSLSSLFKKEQPYKRVTRANHWFLRVNRTFARKKKRIRIKEFVVFTIFLTVFHFLSHFYAQELNGNFLFSNSEWLPALITPSLQERFEQLAISLFCSQKISDSHKNQRANSQPWNLLQSNKKAWTDKRIIVQYMHFTAWLHISLVF